MKFLDLTLKNRSYRAYDESRKITREELEYLVGIARVTPSASNRQPLKYFLACDAETNAKIQPLTGWAGGLPELHLPPEGKRPTAFIVMCVDKTITPDIAHAAKDVGIAAQSMLLAAAEMGLGGIMLGSFRPALKATLGLPENLEISLVVALGKPDEEIKLVEATDSVKYYRDENNVHYVPKRPLDEIIVNGGAK